MKNSLAQKVHDWIRDEAGYRVELSEYNEDDGSLSVTTIWIFDKRYKALALAHLEISGDFWVIYVMNEDDVEEMDDLAEAIEDVFGLTLDVDIVSHDPDTKVQPRSMKVRLIAFVVIVIGIIAIPVIIIANHPLHLP